MRDAPQSGKAAWDAPKAPPSPSTACEEFYDSLSAAYGRRYQGTKGLYFQEREEHLLFKWLPPVGTRCLDLGTGTGRTALELASRGYAVVGIDISSGMIAKARRNAQNCPSVFFCVANGKQFPFSDESFDFVTAVGTFECASNLAPFMAEVNRVLRPNGSFLFSCWNGDRLPGLTLLGRRTPGSVDHDLASLDSQLASSGLERKAFQTTLFFPGILLWGIHRLLPLERWREEFVNGVIRAEEYISRSRWKARGALLLIRAVKTGPLTFEDAM